MQVRWRFLIWLATLTLVGVAVNWPRALLGSLKPFLVWAGLPWYFAHWEYGELMWFDAAALAADVAIAVAVIVPLAWLCARSRVVNRPSRTPVERATSG